MQLGFNLNFADLHDNVGFTKIDEIFLKYLKTADSDLAARLINARQNLPCSLEESNLIIALAPYLQDFLAKLFAQEKPLTELKNKQKKIQQILDCKRLFVQRKALKTHKNTEWQDFDYKAAQQEICQITGQDFSTENFASYIVAQLEAKSDIADIFGKYAAWAVLSEAGRKTHHGSQLFQNPHKLDYANLIATETDNVAEYNEHKFSADKLRKREGFDLTDPGVSFEKASSEAHYCIYCHERGKDSCSKGLKEKNGEFKNSVHDINLAGCPLEEKISEMNLLRSQGYILGALATAMIDNPLLAATGERICNDCMKSCIYQMQEPVNIPQIETENLRQILALDYGFEIYALLASWNPLNFARPLSKQNTNHKILVVGQGPAGFNLAYHLLQEGHQVTAIDGLKIEPLEKNFSSDDFAPIKDVASEIFENLGERISYGFGGVAEYGITVRWNKNYLSLIRIILERHKNYQLFGGVRFGSQITREIAFKQLGFSHIALCMGAGSPNIVPLKNNLSNGVRKASDFLMNLQLSGAFKTDSLANLQIRLPALVIGGGLTAIDTATEILAYYPLQIEKFLQNYEELIKNSAEATIRQNWTKQEAEIADEFIAHAKELRTERKKNNPDINGLIKKWGGVKLVYRKKLIDSPAYRLNHEEVEKAFEEGLVFAEELTPKEVLLDQYDSAKALTLNNKDKASITLPARSILIAAGTKPNTVLAREDQQIETSELYFKALDEQGREKILSTNCKATEQSFITHREESGQAISFFGDMHPSFAGNVVKAMASAKTGYPEINHELSKIKPLDNQCDLADLLKAKLVEVKRLTPNIVEVIVKAPLAAREFKPGQFYRFQNFEQTAINKNGKKLTIEPLALTGAAVDLDKGLVSMIVLEMGGSSNLCAKLKAGEEVVLMGPTGTPTEIYRDKTILLAGGGLGNAVLFSIGKAYRALGSKVLYFAGYKKAIDRYKTAEIEAAADVVIYTCDEQTNWQTNRPQDKVFTGNIIEAMEAYASGKLRECVVDFAKTEHVIAIGSDRMMRAIKEAKNNILAKYFAKTPTAVASINSPMQCMMKEICAQCLQKHIDPVTKKEYFVYSCFNQDQNMDAVDFTHLETRLKQNSLTEKLTAEWLAQNL